MSRNPARTTLVTLLLTLAAVSPLRAAADETALEILQQAVSRAGGMQHWQTAGTLVVHEQQTRHEGGVQKLELVHYLQTDRPRYRLEIESGEDTLVYGWDGQTFWATRNGRPGDEDLLREARRKISDYYYRLSLPFTLLDHGDAEVEYAGTGQHGNTATRIVKFTYADGPTSRYWTASKEGPDRHGSGDAGHSGQTAKASPGGSTGHHHAGSEVYFYHFDADYRIVKIHFSHHGDGTFEDLLFENYRQVNGIRMEQNWRLYQPDGTLHYESTFTEPEFRDDIRPGIYTPPASPGRNPATPD